MSGGFRIFRQFAVLPTSKPLVCTNPQGAVARNQKGVDPIAGQLRTVRRLPVDGLHSIEAEQAGFRAQPQITIGRLRDCKDGSCRETLANRPRSVRVLVDVERGVQRKSARAACQQEGQPDERLLLSGSHRPDHPSLPVPARPSPSALRVTFFLDTLTVFP